MAALDSPGTISCSISKCLVVSSGENRDKPVTLPPGCLILSTKPVLTGSPLVANTIGMVLVNLAAAFAASGNRGHDNVDVAVNQLLGVCWKPLVFFIHERVIKLDIPAFNVSERMHSVYKRLIHYHFAFEIGGVPENAHFPHLDGSPLSK